VGDFAESRSIYAWIAARNPEDYSSAAQLGYIALLANKLDNSRGWLEKALTIRPGDANAHIMLAEVFYRRNDFAEPVAALRGIAPDDKLLSTYATLNLAKLETFQNQTPYDLEETGEITRLKFVRTDPLPLVRVRVNGAPEAVFFIDTGGSELLLDTDYARQLRIKELGSVQGTFSGGQHAAV
jgi:hypothetical protein